MLILCFFIIYDCACHLRQHDEICNARWHDEDVSLLILPLHYTAALYIRHFADAALSFRQFRFGSNGQRRHDRIYFADAGCLRRSLQAAMSVERRVYYFIFQAVIIAMFRMKYSAIRLSSHFITAYHVFIGNTYIASHESWFDIEELIQASLHFADNKIQRFAAILPPFTSYPRFHLLALRFIIIHTLPLYAPFISPHHICGASAVCFIKWATYLAEHHYFNIIIYAANNTFYGDGPLDTELLERIAISAGRICIFQIFDISFDIYCRDGPPESRYRYWKLVLYRYTCLYIRDFAAFALFIYHNANFFPWRRAIKFTMLYQLISIPCRHAWNVTYYNYWFTFYWSHCWKTCDPAARCSRRQI